VLLPTSGGWLAPQERDLGAGIYLPAGPAGASAVRGSSGRPFCERLDARSPVPDLVGGCSFRGLTEMMVRISCGCGHTGLANAQNLPAS
jgi:hypothetical protein